MANILYFPLQTLQRALFQPALFSGLVNIHPVFP